MPYLKFICKYTIIISNTYSTNHKKMVKGEYRFHHPDTKKPRLKSQPWESLLCSLFVFGTICLIIFALTNTWKHRSDDNKTKNHSDYGVTDEFSDNIENISNYDNHATNSKIIYFKNYTSDEDNSDYSDIKNLTDERGENNENASNYDKHATNSKTIYFKNYTYNDDDDYEYVAINDTILSSNISDAEYINGSATQNSTSQKNNYISQDSTQKIIYKTIINYTNDNSCDEMYYQKILQSFITEQNIINNTYKFCKPVKSFENNTTCNLPICKHTASKIISYINHDFDPCDNLYTYACNGVVKDFVIENNKEKRINKIVKDNFNKINNTSPQYLQIFKKFHSTCVSYDVTGACFANIKSLLSSIGIFYPENHTLNDMPPKTEVFTKLLKRNVPVFFDVITDINEKNSTFGIVIKPVSYYEMISNFLENPYEKFCIESIKKKNKFISLHSQYVSYKKCQNDLNQFLSTVSYVSGEISFVNEVNPKQEMRILKKTMEVIFKNVVEILPTKQQIENALRNKDAKFISLNELKESITIIEWEDLFQNLFNKTCEADLQIQVYFLDEIKNFFEKIQQMTNKEIHNSILSIYMHRLYRSFVKDQIIQDRDAYCMDLSKKLMKDITSYLYLESFSREKILSVNNDNKLIYDKIKDTLNTEILNGHFITGTQEEKRRITKIIRLVELRSIENYFDLETINNDLLNSYSEVNITEAFVILGNILETNLRNKMYSLYNQTLLPSHIWTYLANPTDTEIKYLPNLDEILIPFGAIECEDSIKNQPIYLTMSDIGFQLGKVLNKYLNFITNSTKDSDDDFDVEKDPTDPMNEQIINLEMDPTLTKLERRSDITGADLALLSLRRIYNNNVSQINLPLPWLDKTPEELYFLNLIQQFCTKNLISTYMSMFEDGKMHPLYRANNIGTNSAKFSEIFKCDPKNVMPGSKNMKLSDNDY